MLVKLEEFFNEDIKSIKSFIEVFDKKDKLKEEHNLNVPHGVLIIGKDRDINRFLVSRIKANKKYPVIEFDPDLDLDSQLNIDYTNTNIILINDIDKINFDNRRSLNLLKEYLDTEKVEADNVFVVATSSSGFHYANTRKEFSEFADEEMVINPLSCLQLAELFLALLKDKGLKIKGPINLDYLKKTLEKSNISQFEKYIGHLVAKYGTSNLTEENIYDAINDFAIENHNFIKDKFIAVYEAGRCLLSSKSFSTLPSYITTAPKSYVFLADRVSPNGKYEDILSLINTLLAGSVAGDLVFKTNDSTSVCDLDLARAYAAYLVNCLGYKGYDKILAPVSKDIRKNTWLKQYKNEKIISKIVNKQARYVKHYLKDHIDNLYMISEALYQKGYLNIKEICDLVK